MALPQSFQEALGRAETERKIEQDTVLQRIGETVQKGVPLLSGVIAGALSRNPIVGVGAAFIADKLQQRAEEKRQQRATRRFEMRQRKEAAQIAVREGLFQNEKEAMQAIEASRLAEEQENTKKREQEVLQRFGLNREEEKVQEQEKETAEQQEELVREPPQQTGLALESTVSHIDSEISGIADLLLDRFAEEEDRFDRAEDRRELEAARLRETLAEGNRQEPPTTAPVRDREGEKEDGIFSRVQRFLPIVALTSVGTAIVGAITTLGTILVSAITGLATGLAAAMTGALSRGGFLPNRTPVTPTQVPPNDPDRTRARPGAPVQTTPSPTERPTSVPERDRPTYRIARGQAIGVAGRLGGIALLAAAFYDFLTEEDPQLIGFKEIFTGIKNFFTNEDQQIPQGQPDDPNDVMGGFGLDEQSSLSTPVPQPPSIATLGNEMAKVSLATVASAQPVVIAPMTDASTQVQNNINASRQTTVHGGTARNDEIRGKFLQA